MNVRRSITIAASLLTLVIPATAQARKPLLTYRSADVASHVEWNNYFSYPFHYSGGHCTRTARNRMRCTAQYAYYVDSSPVVVCRATFRVVKSSRRYPAEATITAIRTLIHSWNDQYGCYPDDN